MSSTATLPKTKAIKSLSTADAIAVAESAAIAAAKANVLTISKSQDAIAASQVASEDAELAVADIEASFNAGDATLPAASLLNARAEEEKANMLFAAAKSALARATANPANTSKALALITLPWVQTALNDSEIPVYATYAKLSAIGKPDSVPCALVQQPDKEKAQGGAMSGVVVVTLYRKGRHSRFDAVALQKAAQANGCDVEAAVHTQDDEAGNYADTCRINVRYASATEPVLAADPAESAADRFSQGFAAELADRTKSSTDGPVRFNPGARVYSSVTTEISDVSGNLVSVKTDADGSRITTVRVSLTHRSTNIRAAGVPVGTHVAQQLAATVGAFKPSLGRCISADVVATDARPSTDGDASRMSTICTMELAFQSLAA